MVNVYLVFGVVCWNWEFGEVRILSIWWWEVGIRSSVGCVGFRNLVVMVWVLQQRFFFCEEGNLIIFFSNSLVKRRFLCLTPNSPASFVFWVSFLVGR